MSSGKPRTGNLSSSCDMHSTDAVVRFLAAYVLLLISAATQLVWAKKDLTAFACYVFILVISVIFLLKVSNKGVIHVLHTRTILIWYRPCRKWREELSKKLCSKGLPWQPLGWTANFSVAWLLSTQGYDIIGYGYDEQYLRECTEFWHLQLELIGW